MKRISIAIALAVVSLPSLAATCKVSEYKNLAVDDNNRIVSVAVEPASVTQTVTYTTSTELGNDFDEETRFIRIICDAKAHFRFSKDGTDATANDPYLPADTPEYFGIERVGRGQTQTLNVDFYDGAS